MARGGLPIALGSALDESSIPRIENADARDLLLTENKVLAAFDLLAEKINQHLDYPEILVQHGVQGIATLDLYFDETGMVDEDRSKFFGDNRSVRGLLARAARNGVVKWYLSDAGRLRRDQFKNQHFRAEFTIAYALSNVSRIEKPGLGRYILQRRRYVHQCAEPTGVNVVCVAAKAYGLARRGLSADYRMKYEALRDVLEHFDNLGLAGIGNLIAEARSGA